MSFQRFLGEREASLFPISAQPHRSLLCQLSWTASRCNRWWEFLHSTVCRLGLFISELSSDCRCQLFCLFLQWCAAILVFNFFFVLNFVFVFNFVFMFNFVFVFEFVLGLYLLVLVFTICVLYNGYTFFLPYPNQSVENSNSAMKLLGAIFTDKAYNCLSQTFATLEFSFNVSGRTFCCVIVTAVVSASAVLKSWR